jgi:hypothetical protein
MRGYVNTADHYVARIRELEQQLRQARARAELLERQLHGSLRIAAWGGTKRQGERTDLTSAQTEQKCWR